MERKPVLDIKIESNGPALHMTAENGEILMIPFREAQKATCSQASWSRAAWTLKS